MSDLIKVTQLPIIEERLRSMKESVDKRVEKAVSLVCTEDTIQAVKAERSALKKEFEALEEQRKRVKSSIMGPYEDFEKIYKECVSFSFMAADERLKAKIADVENEIKRRCEDGLREYFAELCAVRGLDWLTYERAGIKVDMASAKAKTPKRLRDQLSEFVAQVGDSVERIRLLDDADEIMVEFRRSLDAAGAICTVQERHRRINEEKAQREAGETVRAVEMDMADRVIQIQKTYLQPPAAIVQSIEKDPEEIIPKCTFAVYDAPRRVLSEIKEILERNGVRYE